MIDAATKNWIIDADEANFEDEVLARSQETVVLVDFWAEWCGPCKQLAPLLHKTAKEKEGGFVLAKVNIDENQQLATYFRIESIPTVLAFQGGRPVNGFQGLVGPEELEEFLGSLGVTTGGVPKADPYADALALEETEPAKAEAFYRTVLTENAEDGKALVGLARIQAAAGKDAEAVETLAPLGDTGEHGAEVVKIRRMIEMRANAANAGDETDLRKKIAAEPENPQLRLELGNLLATRADYKPAMDELLVAAELDRELGRGAVRELMVKIFEIIGVRSDMADEYRDKLRGLLY